MAKQESDQHHNQNTTVIAIIAIVAVVAIIVLVMHSNQGSASVGNAIGGQQGSFYL